MPLTELTAQIREFNTQRDWQQFHSPKNLATALMVESAELAEIFQWMTQAESRHPNEDTRQRIRSEIGDILIYLLNISDALGIDPLSAAAAKLALNRRKYPVNLAKGRAAKYDRLDEGSPPHGR
ncbi:MAG: nucleotide pyrophosphohydrolase [Desulfosarcinaceae bacterium]|nr:nucleotide pyrophosphohydrolase [Desulfosarcinaceae bacterium]